VILVFEMCGSINYPYPLQGGLLEILGGGRGGGKGLKANICKGSMTQNWNFQRDFRGMGGWGF